MRAMLLVRGSGASLEVMLSDSVEKASKLTACSQPREFYFN